MIAMQRDAWVAGASQYAGRVREAEKEIELFLEWVVVEKIYRRGVAGWYAANGERFLCSNYKELIEVFRVENTNKPSLNR
jgi:hypothetical protein